MMMRTGLTPLVPRHIHDQADYRPLNYMQIRSNKHTGFSLLELMAVVMIAMFLTIVAVNSYSAMKQRRSLRSGAETVRDVLTNARSLAVSRNAWHRVVFQLRDPNTGD